MLRQTRAIRRLRWFSLVALMLSACTGNGTAAAPAITSTTVAVVTTAVPSSSTPATALAPIGSTGCDGAPPALPGETLESFTAVGLDGTFVRRLPPSYDGMRALPVVIALHGWTQSPALLALESALPAATDAAGYVLVMPDITRAVSMWDVGMESADATWFGELLDEVETSLCIDTSQVFLTGMSNGSMMTSTLLCRFADRITAAAPVAGLRVPEGCEPSRPVPIITFHGTDDPYLAYGGGFGAKVAALAAPDGDGALGDVVASGPDATSVADRVAAWAELNGCAAPLTATRVAADVTLLATVGCAAPVQLYTVESGGHSWPGSAFDQAIGEFVGPTTTSIDATEMMVAFFAEAVQ
ncbi:MAG: PHB depolymerase family esterase [Ilumatobacteraceae bacterium]